MDQAAERLGYENTGKLLHWFALIYSTFISWAFFFFQLPYCCLPLECCVSLSNQYIKFIRRFSADLKAAIWNEVLFL